MTVIDYEETMKCLDEVEDSEDKTYAKSLLEWAINKRTFEAVPLTELKDKMLKYGFTAPDMTVTEFVEDFETL